MQGMQHWHVGGRRPVKSCRVMLMYAVVCAVLCCLLVCLYIEGPQGPQGPQGGNGASFGESLLHNDWALGCLHGRSHPRLEVDAD